MLIAGWLMSGASVAHGEASSDVAPASEEKVSFEAEIMPILKRRCAACHITGEEPGKMALVPGKAYAALVEVDALDAAMKRVARGDPDASYVIHKIDGSHLEVGGSGVRMPMHQGPLPDAQIALIRRWISQGASQD